VVLFNFRADRMRQIVRALAFEDFDGFDRTRGGAWPRVVLTTMTEYDPKFTFPIIYPPAPATGYIAEVLAAHELTNLRLAETEKYAHVTYFFNGGREECFPGEDRVLVPSPKVATYDLQPEMSAAGVADALIASVSQKKHDVIICNFANPDMVGHTGVLDAAITAVQTVDTQIGRIVEAAEKSGATVLVTADHGNAEEMVDEQGRPKTAHTTNPVPVIIVRAPETKAHELRSGGRLSDVAPTVLQLLGLSVPPGMTARSLIES